MFFLLLVLARHASNYVEYACCQSVTLSSNHLPTTVFNLKWSAISGGLRRLQSLRQSEYKRPLGSSSRNSRFPSSTRYSVTDWSSISTRRFVTCITYSVAPAAHGAYLNLDARACLKRLPRR